MPIRLAIYALLASLPSGFADATTERIRMLTEEYPPYNYTDNGKITGAAVDQVAEIMDRAGLAYDLEMLPWARAYARAENEPMTCLFSTNHSVDRDLKFAWVEPLGVSTLIMIGRKDSGLTIAALEDIRGLKIGTQLSDFTETFLRERGFNDLDLAPDFTLTLKKLESGRIDIAFTSRAAFKALVADGYRIEALMELPAQVYGIACHRSFPAPLIARMQDQLDAMIADGTQDRIMVRYGLPAANLAPVLQKSQ